MPAEPLVLLNYRLAIARIGERDVFGWWESNALTKEGQFALGRLFRQNFTWVGVELALEAARLRHRALIPPGDRINLFNLGPEIEDSFSSWLRRAKVENQADAVKFPTVAEGSSATVAQAFHALGITVEEPKVKDVEDRAIQVGQVHLNDLRADPVRVAHNLLAGYLKSSRGKFIAPYATVKPGHS